MQATSEEAAKVTAKCRAYLEGHRGRPALYKEVSAFEASPALVAVIIATLLFLDHRCHSYLPHRSPYHVRSGGLRMTR
jgi:hypothetical protein